MAESKYFPDLINGEDNADVNQVEEAFTLIESDINTINTALNNKVDKAVGMGLTRIFEMGDHYVVHSQGGDVEVYSNEQTDNLALPKNTVSGSKIKLTDHLENKPIISCKIYGTEAGVGDLVSSGEHAGKYKIPVSVRGENIWNNNTLNLRAPNTKTETGFIVTGYSNIIKDGSVFKEEAQLKVGDIIRFSYIVVIGETPSGSIGSVYFGSLCPVSISLASKGIGTYQVISDYVVTSLDFNNVRFYGDNKGKSVEYKNVQIIKVDAESYKSTVNEGNNIDWNYEEFFYPYRKEIYVNTPLGENESVSIDGLSTIASSVNTINVETENAPSKIEVQYYRDINKVLANLENAILSQGGNV